MRRRIVSVIIDCMDCNWRTEDYKKGLIKAKKHSSKTGHRMSGNIGYAIRLGPL